MLGEDEQRLAEAMALIREVNLGATAIGPGINTDVGYAKLAIAHLSSLSGLPLEPAPNMIEATQDTGAFVQLSGVQVGIMPAEDFTSATNFCHPVLVPPKRRLLVKSWRPSRNLERQVPISQPPLIMQ